MASFTSYAITIYPNHIIFAYYCNRSADVSRIITARASTINVACDWNTSINVCPNEGKVDISNLYHGLDPSQMDEARDNLAQFLGVIFRISERQAKDVPPAPVAEPVKVI